MKCDYPNCRKKAKFTPVLKVPTMRSVGETTAWVQTSEPTLLCAPAVCENHKEGYSIADRIPKGDWEAMQDVAHQQGYHLQDREFILVEFMPVGYVPPKSFLVQR